MHSPTIVCRNPECRDSISRRRDAPQLKMTAETEWAWTFICVTCEREGRHSGRCVTKDIAGGMVGAGKRDFNVGTTTGKGPDKYRFGWRPE